MWKSCRTTASPKICPARLYSSIYIYSLYATNTIGYVCQSHHGIAEAVTGVLGGAQFPSGPFYHPRSSRGRFGHPREAAVRAGNFPDSNGISDDFKRQNRSHETEPVPPPLSRLMTAPLITFSRIHHSAATSSTPS